LGSQLEVSALMLAGVSDSAVLGRIPPFDRNPAGPFRGSVIKELTCGGRVFCPTLSKMGSYPIPNPPRIVVVARLPGE
jgi:hypothetical protein